MQKQVDMCINQTRQQRGVTQVDHLRPGRMRHGGAHGCDALADHQHFSRRDHPPCVDFQQVRRVQHYGTRRCLLREEL